MKTRLTFVLMFMLCGPAAAAAQEPDGTAIFEAQCAMCHTPPGVERAPTLETLRGRSPVAIVAALTSGIMALEGQDLTDPQRRAVAEFITGRAVGDAVGTGVGLCESTPAIGTYSAAPTGMDGARATRTSVSRRRRTPGFASTRWATSR